MFFLLVIRVCGIILRESIFWLRFRFSLEEMLTMDIFEPTLSAINLFWKNASCECVSGYKKTQDKFSMIRSKL